MITLKSYNLKEAELEIVLQLVKDKPDLTMDEYAELLGKSVRTVFRMFQDYNINNRETLRKKKVKKANAIDYLKSMGYIVRTPIKQTTNR